MLKSVSYKGRSVWKGFCKNILNKLNGSTNRVVTVTRDMLGKQVNVYTGKRWVPISIRKKHLGFKLGQFVFTKKMGKNIHGQVKSGKDGIKGKKKK